MTQLLLTFGFWHISFNIFFGTVKPPINTSTGFIMVFVKRGLDLAVLQETVLHILYIVTYRNHTYSIVFLWLEKGWNFY